MRLQVTKTRFGGLAVASVAFGLREGAIPKWYGVYSMTRTVVLDTVDQFQAFLRMLIT